MNGFLLDTDTCSYAMRGQHGVAERLARTAPSRLFVSAITLAEAWTGARRSDRARAIEAQWAWFLAPFAGRVLPFDAAAADRYATARAHLEFRGEMIGDRDCMLGGIALANGLDVVTRNQREFGRIPGLGTVDWSAPAGRGRRRR